MAFNPDTKPPPWTKKEQEPKLDHFESQNTPPVAYMPYETRARVQTRPWNRGHPPDHGKG